MLHRVINAAVDIACDNLVDISTNLFTTDHNLRLNIIQCSKDCYNFSFMPRTKEKWDYLPPTPTPDIVQLLETKPF